MRHLKVKLLNYCLGHLFNAVTEDDYFYEDAVNKKLMIGNIPASDQKLKNFKAEAQFMLQSELYPQLLKDLQYTANKKMFINSNNVDDMIFGKAVLFCIDVMHKKIKILANDRRI
jgi:hypothetical protein